MSPVPQYCDQSTHGVMPELNSLLAAAATGCRFGHLAFESHIASTRDLKKASEHHLCTCLQFLSFLLLRTKLLVSRGGRRRLIAGLARGRQRTQECSEQER